MEKINVYFYDGIPSWMPSPIIRIYVPFLTLFIVLLVFPFIALLKGIPELLHNIKTCFQVMFYPHNKDKPAKLRKRK